MYPAGPVGPPRTAWLRVGVVDAEADPIWVGGGLRLYGPRLTPFLRTFLVESTQVSARPYLIQRVQGLPSSHFLHAFWQFTMNKQTV